MRRKECRRRHSYQSIGFVFQLAWLSFALAGTADTPQLLRGVAERLLASSRPRAEVVVSQGGVDVLSVLFGGTEVAAPRDGDKLSMIPRTVARRRCTLAGRDGSRRVLGFYISIEFMLFS